MEPCYGNKFKYHFRITTILKYYFFVFCIYSSYIYFGCYVKMVFNVEVVFKFVASEWIHMFLLMGQPSGARGAEPFCPLFPVPIWGLVGDQDEHFPRDGQRSHFNGSSFFFSLCCDKFGNSSIPKRGLRM